MNFMGIMLVRKEAEINDRVINHESIHTAQMRELAFVFFYVAYLLEWVWRIVEARGDTMKAYHRISMEREAYKHDHDFDYLRHRRHFAQWRKEPEVKK